MVLHDEVEGGMHRRRDRTATVGALSIILKHPGELELFRRGAGPAQAWTSTLGGMVRLTAVRYEKD